MTKRAVLYARVSSDDTRKDGRNLAGQLDMCRDYAKIKGWQVVSELKEDDRGASGASWDLPQLNQALDMARAGDFDILVTRELDRFARGLAKQLVIESEFKRHGVQLQYVLGDYADNPEGELSKQIRAVIAEYERNKINERMIRGKRLKVKMGNVIVSGKPPYGYSVKQCDNVTILVIDEEEAAVVKLIFTWYVFGDGDGKRLAITTIAKRLTEMGVLTWEDKYGGKRKKSKRGHWSAATISSLLSNETYAGLWAFNKTKTVNGKRQKRSRDEWITLDVPPIVSREVWDSAQNRKRVNQKKARRNRKYDYLMAGNLVCGQCGQNVTGRSARVINGKMYSYYGCYGDRRDAPKKCDLLAFNAQQVEEAIWSWVKSFLLDPNALHNGLIAYQAQQGEKNVPLHSRLEITNNLIIENQTKLNRLLDIYLEGGIAKDLLVDRKMRLEKTIKSLEQEQISVVAQLEAGMLTDEQIKTIEEFAREVAAGVDEADEDFESRRGIIELLHVKATLAIEDGDRILYASCGLGSEVLIVKTKITG